MNQASRFIAQWTGVADVIGHDAIACAAWKKAVGKRVAARTSAVKLVRKTLVIEVEDEIWKRNLWGLRYQILRNLENALGPGVVEEIELRIMPLRREPARAAVSQSADDADGISDPGLRRLYKAARLRESTRRQSA